MKNTMRKAMLSTIAMLVVAVMSLTGVTYAWFSAATTAKVDGFEMNIGAAGAGLQVSATGGTDDSAWSSTVSYGAKVDDVLPVSTIDAQNFFTASVDVNDTNKITSISEAKTGNVITKSLFMRNTGNGDLTVQLDAAAVANVFTTTKTGKATPDAARVAVLQVTEDGKELLWVYGDIDNANGIQSAPESFPAGGYKVDTVSTGVITKLPAQFVTSATSCTITVPADNVPVELEVVVWLEGQDPECNNDVALSDFSATLNFTVVADSSQTN